MHSRSRDLKKKRVEMLTKKKEEEGKPWKEAQKHNMIYAMWFGGAF